MSDTTDEELMQQYAQGHFPAFEVLYERHKGGVYRYLLRQCAEQSLAEDLFQDVWAKVISNAVNYQVKAKFSTWLYTIAHNKLVDQVRHLKVVDKVLVVSEDEPAEQHQQNTADKAYQQDITSSALKHCLSKLPQLQLDSFLLKEEGAMSVAQVAEVLDATVEATKSRLRYAYKSLRECVELKLGKQVA